eukprot:1025683-Pleurochrysis_carterae.AAC.2
MESWGGTAVHVPVLLSSFGSIVPSAVRSSTEGTIEPKLDNREGRGKEGKGEHGEASAGQRARCRRT